MSGIIQATSGQPKNFTVTEGLRAQFRWEAFNLFNHSNFGIPTTDGALSIDLRGGNLGEGVNTVGRERVIQLSLRLEF